jgi:predicted alpha/beta hydrolase
MRKCLTKLFWYDDDDDVRFVVDQHDELDFYKASSLKQQSAGRHVAPLGHNIFWFRDEQSFYSFYLILRA